MLAVSAWFNPAAEASIRDLWRKLADARIDDTLHTGLYLGVWEDVPLDAASERLPPLTSALSAFQVTFRAIGVYPGHPVEQDRQAGVYLAPTVTSALRELHEKVHGAIAEIASGAIERHVPGRWEPHCTLTPTTPRSLIGRAVEQLIAADVLPLTVTITRIGLIETPAEVELQAFTIT